MRLLAPLLAGTFAIGLAGCGDSYTSDCVQIKYREVETIPSVEEFRQVAESCKSIARYTPDRLQCVEAYTSGKKNDE